MISRVLLVAYAIWLSARGYSQEQEAERGHVHTEMRNVLYHFTDSASVHIVYLEGELIPTSEHGIPVFDDANSFALGIHSAEIIITIDALANALSQYAFATSDAPIKQIRISTEGGKMKIKGQLHSEGNVPFESEGSLSVTPQGEIRVHAEKIKAAHLPVKGLMDLLGATIAKLIDSKKVHGVRAEKDDLLLHPSELFPPPHIEGGLSAIMIRGNEIVLRYGNASAP